MHAVCKFLLSASVALAASLGSVVVAPSLAHADDAPAAPTDATFAIAIGVNKPVDADLAPLRYADDDAARSYDLMRAVGVPTWVLARMDDNTARLHERATSVAKAPTLAALREAVREVQTRVHTAKALGQKTTVYVFYAGHGSVRSGEGYVTLEDAHLTGADLAREITTPIDADRYHVVLDACSAHAIAFGRGPGGSRRDASGLQDMARLKDDPRVGLLVATTTAAETHEWDAISAGIFTHEVRSGLLGAADADGDGKITYREMVAFVRQANEDVPNERFRPQAAARPPQGSEVFFDASHAPVGRVVIEGAAAGRWVIEDARGVRIADVHTAPNRRTVLLRTSPTGFYVRSVSGSSERFVPFGGEAMALADIPVRTTEATSRGAAHESFTRLFAHAFDASRVMGTPYDDAPVRGLQSAAEPDAPRDAKKVVGVTALAVGGAALVAGGVLALAASQVKADTAGDASQATVARHNDTIRALGTASTVSLLAGGALGITGVTLLVLPASSSASAVNGGGNVSYSMGVVGRF